MIRFKKGAGENVLTFPLTQEQIDNLKPSRLVNPVVGRDHGYKIPDDFDQVASMHEILRVRLEVTKGIFPRWFMEKYYPFEGEFPEEIPACLAAEGLSFDDPQGLANVVHMDSPLDCPMAMWRQLLVEGANAKRSSPDVVNFFESVVNPLEDIPDYVKRALKKGWEIKWYFGVARPEEVLEEITGVDGRLMTAYPEGSPTHSSLVAGHSCAVAGGAVAVIRHFKMTDKQLKEILDAAYMWGQFRSLAGVHFGVDNLMGIAVGGLERYMRPEVVAKFKK